MRLCCGFLKNLMKIQTMAQVRGIIFDLDGTLVDSKLDYESMRKDMGLPPNVPILEALEAISAGPQRDHMMSVLHVHELRGADSAELIDGVIEFLAHVDQREISTAVLTRNSRVSTDRVLARLNLSFSQVVTREDAAPKPDPAGACLIAERWGLPAHEVIIVGDYLFDLQAGRRAGMRSILFAPEERPDFAHEADFMLAHFREAVNLLDRLIREEP